MPRTFPTTKASWEQHLTKKLHWDNVKIESAKYSLLGISIRKCLDLLFKYLWSKMEVATEEILTAEWDNNCSTKLLFDKKSCFLKVILSAWKCLECRILHHLPQSFWGPRQPPHPRPNWHICNFSFFHYLQNHVCVSDQSDQEKKILSPMHLLKFPYFKFNVFLKHSLSKRGICDFFMAFPFYLL